MRDGRVWGSVLLVVIGALLLLNNLGYLAPLGLSAWQLIGPLVLIGLGGWMLWSSIAAKPRLETATLAIPRGEETAARITLEFGGGVLNVAHGAASDTLLTGTFGGEVERSITRAAGQADMHLKTPLDVILPWEWMSGCRQTWDILLNESLPLELVIKTGASDTTLDLTHLRVTKLTLESGANSMRVQLPARAGHTEVRGTSGMASLSLHVPEGVAARIHTEGGLNSCNVDTERFPRVGQGYESPEYATAPYRVDIRLEAGISSLTVR